MGLMFLTVIGYMVCMGIVAGTIMYYLTQAFDSTQAEIIDPQPDTK